MFTALEFFAGSGLVHLGLSPDFSTVWANDNSRSKFDTYKSNHRSAHFVLGGIENVRGVDLPRADLAWASFPCQDLSLAGNLSGMDHGTRSGLFWEWVRILRELKQAGTSPSVLLVENVVGFLVAGKGDEFKRAYQALRELGFLVGGLVIDANAFLPQSRPRAFLAAVRADVSLTGLRQNGPAGPFHTATIIRAAHNIGDLAWVWWSLPTPELPRVSFDDLCEWDAPCDPEEKTARLREMLSDTNKRKLDVALRSGLSLVGTAYRRSRPDAQGRSRQRLEVRFDGTAGCLRTPNGGSSRQTVLLVDKGRVRSRLMTVRECARLMGAPDSYRLPGSYNDGYRAMGDGVAVPVTRWLTRHLLAPLALRSRVSPWLEHTEPQGSVPQPESLTFLSA